MEINVRTAAKGTISIAALIALLILSCGRRGDIAHDAYVLADNAGVTREAGKTSARAGALVFLDGVRFVSVDDASGRARVESGKGIAGWIDLAATSRVPAAWKEERIDGFISIYLPPDQRLKAMKSGAEPGESDVTEYKFFNENYFINVAHNGEPYSDAVAQARESAAHAGMKSGMKEISLNGLEGVFHAGQADVDGMACISWIIRGGKNDSYIFTVILQKEKAGSDYELTARRILFSAWKLQ